MSILFDLTKRPTRHSYSAIKKYKGCPTAYALSYIQRWPDPPSAAMMRGTRLHKLAEDYMTASFETPVPYDVKRIGLKLYQLREHGALPEQEWMVDRDWQPTEDKEAARLKAVVDVHWLDKTILRIHDYKSGRPYADHDDQLDLYAVLGLCRFPDAKRAEASAIYIDSGNEGGTKSVIREMLPHKIRLWTADLDRIDGDEHFLPTPSGICSRCNYRSSEGGPCEAWREVRR